MFCYYLTPKQPNQFVCCKFCHCLYHDMMSWCDNLIDFRKILWCPSLVSQADAESIVSAAYGSHKALRYQDFLKFFLPEAAPVVLMSRDKALSLKAFDYIITPLLKNKMFWCRWPMIWKIKSPWPATWKMPTFAWSGLSAPPFAWLYVIFHISSDWHLHKLSIYFQIHAPGIVTSKTE